MDLKNVGFVSYAIPTAEPTEFGLQPTMSLSIAPSKNKVAAAGTKQEKEKKHISLFLMPHPNPNPPTNHPTNQEPTSAPPLLTLYLTSKTMATEWRDALRFLIGSPPGEETEEFTRRLADVGVRVKLLDIVAGGVEIPTTKPPIEGASTVPGSTGKVTITGEFWYDSMVD